MAGGGINRQELISRHNPLRKGLEGEPLSVGNGRFCFTADWTGLQTFDTGKIPLLTMAEWFWHSYPDAPRDDAALRLESFDNHGRTVGYASDETGQEELFYALRQNRHKGNLARIAFVTNADTAASAGTQTLDIWTGMLFSNWRLDGADVKVETFVHPALDAVYVRARSPQSLRVKIEFPYPVHTKNAGDFSAPRRHTTTGEERGGALVIHRQIDQTECFVVAAARNAACRREGHCVMFDAQDSLELCAVFSPESPTAPPPSFEDAAAAARDFWADYWERGGAIAISGDKTALELERRVVLSQYLCAIQCRGKLPPAETGLTCNSWYGKFHLEMHFWHHAHFALWGRSAVLEQSMAFYHKILDAARNTARAQGYHGARWPKMCDASGYNSPSSIAPLLIWQQPHPIMFVFLLARAAKNNSERKRIIARHREIIFETAEFMAAFIFVDEHGAGHLGPPAIPVQERFDARTVENPAFELEYWHWGLTTAASLIQELDEKSSLVWKKAADTLPLPAVKDNVYLAHANCPATWSDAPFRTDHPSMLMMKGVLPGARIDNKIMNATLDAVLSLWNRETLWGWDFPMMAMTAAALGRNEDALRLLMMNNSRNRYLANGHNEQGDNDELPLYLPGNAALLLATAALKDRFPAHWRVRCEGIGTWHGFEEQDAPVK